MSTSDFNFIATKHTSCGLCRVSEIVSGYNMRAEFKRPFNFNRTVTSQVVARPGNIEARMTNGLAYSHQSDHLLYPRKKRTPQVMARTTVMITPTNPTMNDAIHKERFVSPSDFLLFSATSITPRNKTNVTLSSHNKSIGFNGVTFNS